MIIQFSHILAFAVLALAAAWDLKTTEVPDWLSLLGVCGGIVIHAAASVQQGSWTPIQWSLGVGAAFSLYGWGMYFAGMWGGADAYATSILGFAAPYGIAGPSLLYPANLLVNLMLVGFVYTLGFAVFKSFRSGSAFSATWGRLKAQRLRIGLESIAAIAVAVSIEILTNLNGAVYLAWILGMIVLVRFLRAVENDLMVEEKSLEEVSEGEVVSEVDGRIRGATREELDKLEVEKVEVKSGVKFIPAFPLALLITDILGGGIQWLVLLIS